MSRACVHPEDPGAEVEWRKDGKLAREGFKDLEYMPRGRTAWNATLAAFAYSARRRLSDRADLNVWAAMHAAPPSRRYEELGGDGLVLWHGTTAARAEKIRRHGLFHKRGVWAATEPAIAHGYTRGRSTAFRGGSAMVILLIDRNEWASKAERESENIARFHESIPRRCVEYILFRDRIEFLGEARAKAPKPWGVARFKRRHGRWVPRSRPPVRFDGRRSYAGWDEWLDLSVRRVLATLGKAAAVEVFSSLYATIDPWDALEHKEVFAALERLAGAGRPGRGGMRVFSPAEAPP